MNLGRALFLLGIAFAVYCAWHGWWGLILLELVTTLGGALIVWLILRGREEARRMDDFIEQMVRERHK